MLVDKTVKVEKEVDEIMAQVVKVLRELKAGESVGQIALEQIMALQILIKNFQAVPGDYLESFSGTMRAVLENLVDIASVLLDKDAQPL